MSLFKILKDRINDIVISNEVSEKLKKIPNKFNELGYDNWGMHLDTLQKVLIALKWMSDKYFRTEVHGIDDIPANRVMLVANHGGQLPIDAALVCYAMCMHAQNPRVVRTMADRFMPSLPFVNILVKRSGQILGTPENCRDLLHNDEAVMTFPEGTRGLGKLYWKRYQLQSFGSGFMRIALETDTPIVPVAIIGTEEAYPSFYNIKSVAKLLKIPYFPITPFWPFLGPLGCLPLPVKVKIYFGKPIIFSGDFDGSELEIRSKVDIVHNCIREMIKNGLRKRKQVFS